MKLILLCSKQIEAFEDGKEYPCAEYLMEGIPSWLHQYFPIELVDSNCEAVDHHTTIEFKYRPAKMIEEWRSHVPHGDALFMVDCELNGLLWYREGYWPSGDYEYIWDDGILFRESTSTLCESVDVVSLDYWTRRAVLDSRRSFLAQPSICRRS